MIESADPSQAVRCLANGNLYNLSQTRPAYTIPSSLKQYLKNKGFVFDEDRDHISLDEYARHKRQHLRELLEKDKKELTELEQDVLASFEDHDLMSADVDSHYEGQLSFADRLSDKIAEFGGSWRFIITFFVIIVIWMVINAVFLAKSAFDPYPFILLNLVLSCLAAIQAPIIMMSQNRQETRDRMRSKSDYKVNLKAELEIRMLHEKLDFILHHQGEHLHSIQKQLLDLEEDLAQIQKETRNSNPSETPIG